MTIETEHRGYKISYAENEDVWRCWDLEEDAPTLSALKRKIDKHDKARRTATEVIPAVRISSGGGLSQVSIHMLAEAPSDRKYGEHAGKAWVYTDLTERKGRDKVKLDELAAPAHPDTAAALEAYRQAVAEEREARARTLAALKVIPRFTYEVLAALLPMSET